MSEKMGPEDAALKIVRNNIIGIIRDMCIEDLHVVESFLHELKQNPGQVAKLDTPVTTTPPRGADRRKFRRIEMNLPIMIKPAKTPDKRVRVNTCDISGGGARFSILEPVEMLMGDYVELQMMLPDGQQALKIQSRVVRIFRNDNGDVSDIGIEFSYISSQNKDRIQRFTGIID